MASSVAAVTVNTPIPTAPVIASFSPDSGTVGDGLTNVNILTLTGTAVANSTVNLYDGATLLGNATANGSGAWTYTTAALADGSHSLTATDTVAGITSAASSALAVTVDTHVPVTPSIVSFSIDSGIVGDHITNDNTPMLTGTAEANSTVKVYDGATLLGSTIANGSGAWTYTTAVLSDGVHSLTATDTDAAGTTSTASTELSLTIDTTPPVPVITGETVLRGSYVSLTGTSEPYSTVSIYDGTSGTLLGTAMTAASGSWSLLRVRTTATVFKVTAVDLAGNTSPTSNPQAPVAPTITSFSPDSGTVGDGLTNVNILTLTGTAEANSTVKVYDGTTLLGSATANGSGAWSFTTGTLASTTHSFTATATDAAGNTGVASTALSVTVDTVAPTAPSITSDVIVNANEVALTGTAEANSTVKVYDGTTLLGSATVNGTGTWSYTTGILANGTHSFTATDTDAAGNTGVASSVAAVTVNTPIPTAPVIASFSPDSGTVGDGLTNVNILTLTGTAVANSTVNLYDGATLLGNATANGSGAWTYTTAALADGSHSLTATDTVAGITSAASSALAVTVDTHVPVTPSIVSFSIDSGIVGDHITNDNTPMLTGTAEANSTVKVYDGATLLGSTIANGSGAWTYTTAVLSDGVHSLTATDTDAAGTTSTASTELSLTTDTTAPSAPSIVSDLIVNTNEASLAGTAEANSMVTLYDGTTLLGSVATNGSGAWSYTTGTLTNGTHGFIATATDVAGNISAGSSISNVTVDTSQTAIAVNVNAFSLLTRSSGLLSGTSESNSAISIFDDSTGLLISQTTASSTGTWSVTLRALTYSVHDFTVAASDQAAETGSTHVVTGTMGNDTITNTAPNEVLFGNGGIDTFVFSGSIGKDTIADFQASSDVLQLSHNVFASFADVLAHAAQVGSDVTISLDASNSVTLHNTALAQLTANNFHLV